MATDGSHGHGPPPEPTGPTHGQPYEPDKFSVKTILAVPTAVIVTGFLAYVTTNILFNRIFDPNLQDQPVIPGAAAQNGADLNERVSRISSTNPASTVDNPRLEGIQVREKYDAGGTYPVTSDISTTQPAKEGNSPRYKHTDLWPQNVEILHRPGDGKVPIDQAMTDLLTGGLLKARSGAAPVGIYADWDRPKESNGGRDTRGGQLDPHGPAAKKDEGKKDAEPKKDEGKKDEGKKE